MSNIAVNPHPGTGIGCQVNETYPVVIVGAGPTGLTAGNLLGMSGIQTLIVECNPELSDHPKAISLDDEGLRICQALGLGSAINHSVLLDINAHYVSAGRLLAKVAPTNRRNGHPLISTFNQPEFEAALLAGLTRFESVTVRFQHTVESLEQTETCVVVSVRTPHGTLQKIKCAYLLACDGGRSTIRHALNMPMKGTTFAQQWLVIDCIADEQPSAIAMFFCNPHRPAVTVPSPHNGRRWEFMLLPGETEKDMLRPENIAALIQQAGGSPHSQIIRKTVYTFHSTLAKHFSKGRVFLLGDAAHMMPPFGGQGLNSGLRDAHNLAWKLSMVLHGHASPQLLETYHQERHRHVAQMIHFSSFLGNIVMSTAKPVAFCRNMLVQILNTIPAICDFLTEARIKPQPKYKKGFFLSGGGHGLIKGGKGRAIAGLLLPQPEVVASQGQRVLLDEMLGTGFALLRLHYNPVEAFASLKSDFWQRIGARFICVQPRTTDRERKNKVPMEYAQSIREGVQDIESTQPPLIVVQSQDTNFLGNNQDLFVVIRPDRYILGVFKAEKADSFVSAFQRLLQ